MLLFSPSLLAVSEKRKRTFLNLRKEIYQKSRVNIILFFFFLKILFIHLTEIETASERGNTSRVGGRGRSRLIAEEPDVGLDPITPGSRPEPKAEAQPLCHPGAPIQVLMFRR